MKLGKRSALEKALPRMVLNAFKSAQPMPHPQAVTYERIGIDSHELPTDLSSKCVWSLIHILTPAVIYKKYPEMRVQYVVGQNLLYKKLR